jgi:Secretion system C-terminal sorting domain
MKPSVQLLIPLVLLFSFSGKGQSGDYASVYHPAQLEKNKEALNLSENTFEVFAPACVASAGKLKPYRQVCYDGITRPLITAVVEAAPIVPPGFKVTYVFSSGPDMVIMKAAPRELLSDPRYIEYVSVETGLFRIHTLVYNPQDTGLLTRLTKYGTTRILDIHRLLIQGGGKLCGALDLGGALFNVPACTCPAKAGTLVGIDFFDDYPCLKSGSAKLRAKVAIPSVVPIGYQVRYILSKGDSLVVSQIKAVPEFNVTTVGRYRIHTLVYHISSLNPSDIRPGVTNVRDIYNRIYEGGNYACGSINVQGNLFFDLKPCAPLCSADAGTLKFKSQTCVSNIPALIQATTLQAPIVPTGFKVTYVLTSTDNLIIQKIESFAPEFKVNTPGRYRIHTLVYNPTTFDFSGIIFGSSKVSVITKQLIKGGGVNCGAWDENGVVFDVLGCNCSANAGSLGIYYPSPCISTGPIQLSAHYWAYPSDNPPGLEITSVLTRGDDLTILQIGTQPFTVSEPGRYRIHTLVYDRNTMDLRRVVLGTTKASAIYNQFVQGGGTLCGKFDVLGAVFDVTLCPCEQKPFAGKLLPVGQICYDGVTSPVLIAEKDVDPVIPTKFKHVYIVSFGEDMKIEGHVLPENLSDPRYIEAYVNSREGIYRIHSLVYNPSDSLNFIFIDGRNHITDIHKKLIQGGGQLCGALDLEGAFFKVPICPCPAKIGTLDRIDYPEYCLNNGPALLRATEGIPSVVPPGFKLTYLLSKADSRVVLQINGKPEFKVNSPGVYSIHILIYPTSTFNIESIQPGITTAREIRNRIYNGLNPNCGAFHLNGDFPFIVEAICKSKCTGGNDSLAVFDQTCLPIGGKARLRAQTSGVPSVPGGLLLRYVLTSGENFVIENISPVADFYVSRTGRYRIHTLVYNPLTLNLAPIIFGRTPASYITNQLIQGGGQICGDLDLYTGAAVFDVLNCFTCTAYAGTLKPTKGSCLNNNQALLVAGKEKSPFIPDGFQLRFILSRGNDMLISAIGDKPEFYVNATGTWRIHTVVYNPVAFNLSGINFNTTSIQVLKLLLARSYACFSLDEQGAVFEITCAVCTVSAGTLKPGSQTCWSKEDQTSGQITALVDTPPIIPAGFQRRYIITRTYQGNLITTAIASETPTFVVPSGNYRIHTLIYNPTDPEFSNLNGYRNLADINKLLIQGGGKLCGALDLTGAAFNVPICPCAAKAGTLVTVDQPCLNAGLATIRANVGTPSVVPEGFKLFYLLTEGDLLVIRQFRTAPVFSVTTAGRYRIHTMVYHPNTINPSTLIQFGVTTASYLRSLLIEGGSTYCGSINLDSPIFAVNPCVPPCTASAGTLIPNNQPCLGRIIKVNVQAAVGTQPNIPLGYVTLYLLTSGDNKVIENVGNLPNFDIYRPGKFRIHTLVYHPNLLDFTIYLGGTKLSELNELLIQGGGKVCGSLDLSGALFDIVHCALGSGILGEAALDSNNQQEERSFTQVYPNPTKDRIRLIFNGLKQKDGTDLYVEILNLNGNILNREKFDAGTSDGELDLKSLPAGIYFIRVLRSGEAPELIRISKM